MLSNNMNYITIFLHHDVTIRTLFKQHKYTELISMISLSNHEILFVKNYFVI